MLASCARITSNAEIDRNESSRWITSESPTIHEVTADCGTVNAAVISPRRSEDRPKKPNYVALRFRGSIKI
jgi:hypothetical protein